jgi:hypothetical protein
MSDEQPPLPPPTPGVHPGGRPPKHSHRRLRQTLTLLTTRRLDGRSAVAVAVRALKADIRRDLGDDLSRAQELILEDIAQSWVIRQSLDDFIARQPTLVTRKRALLPIVAERMRIAEHLARQLDRLGLERKPAAIETLQSYLAKKAAHVQPAE